MIESATSLTLALISDIFDGPNEERRLTDVLRRARSLGAQLAVLPELPLNRWAPATQTPCDEDAEAPNGWRHRMLSATARAADIGVIGGAIVKDPGTEKRYNTTLVFDASGTQVGTYRKVHLPEEEGFWETRHYEPGDALPPVIDAFGMPLGVQVCSDVNRPEGSHILAALGAEAILCPRATEASTFDRWRTVFVANAITSCAFVVSVARPRAELGVPLGGPSLAVAPTGAVLAETVQPITVIRLERKLVEEARRRYPGYLATRANVYAQGWSRVKSSALPYAG
jgi:predicted amidohydrolase